MNLIGAGFKTSCASYCGYSEDTSPIYYNGSVYYGDEVYATEDQYAELAQQIVAAGTDVQPAEDEKWQALGVFAMAEGDETSSNDIFQLAIHQDGIVRGNYYDAVSDSTTPIVGSLDKQSQRVARTMEGKQEPVYEAGLYNLTQDATTLLVHFDKDRTEQYELFQIRQNEEDAQAKQSE